MIKLIESFMKLQSILSFHVDDCFLFYECYPLIDVEFENLKKVLFWLGWGVGGFYLRDLKARR